MFVLFEPYIRFHSLSCMFEYLSGRLLGNSCSPAYDMYSKYKYLIFAHLGFWSGNVFLIPPFLIIAY